ncbi:DUF1491 family protein [uncultured Hyphomicrobium sp.]|uniref:DUF1491 family protein n=1 Tax=uncultured Hyphomicrobium sp. TaxID=194373 RepID=UPI0025F3C1FF|nr:DUF1491 family protein [uncultured Hyphomicrobium sp.]
MRLKSEIWVKAYVRRVGSAGRQAFVVRHGDDDAGAIYIRINRLDGTSTLFGPAPASLSGLETDRRWVAFFKGETRSDLEVESLLEREARTDPDLWIIEVEARDGEHGLEGWLTEI